MYAQATKKNKKLFGYKVATNQGENDPDIKALFTMAAKDKASKLVVFGGLHGYAVTGAPTGQTPDEKKICSFSMGDQKNKSAGTGINFIYENIAKYTTKGSDVTKEKQEEIKEKIQSYLKGGYYVLLSWCYSHVWVESKGL